MATLYKIANALPEAIYPPRNVPWNHAAVVPATTPVEEKPKRLAIGARINPVRNIIN